LVIFDAHQSHFFVFPANAEGAVAVLKDFPSFDAQEYLEKI
jgi:hypothetical protein